jgi:predicted HicB family RNase H-like nuclease
MKRNATERLNVWIARDDHLRLRTLATSQQVTLSTFVRQLINAGLHDKNLAGLVSVIRGRPKL